MLRCFTFDLSSLPALRIGTALGLTSLGLLAPAAPSAFAAGTGHTEHAVPASHGLQVDRLRCEYKVDPLGVGTLHPRLSWEVASPTREQRQTAYEVWVADSPEALNANQGNLWHSGKVNSDQTAQLAYAGASLRSGQKCWWKVRVWDKDGKPSISAASSWQMGLLNPTDWKAQWISAATPRKVNVDGINLPPSPYLRRTFNVTKSIKHATIYVTARGLYELHLNGERIGDALLNPGWTDYRKHIDYQAYDVASHLHRGANTVGAILGDGWYSGYVGFARQRDNYGPTPQLLAQLNIEYADGSKETIGSDPSWSGGVGPIGYSDMLMGERYDSRQELTGWDLPGFRPTNWQPAVIDKGIDLHNGTVDITDVVRKMAQGNTLSVTASNDLGGDPAYNTVKRLRVDYTIGGQLRTHIVPEKGTVQIPAAGESGKLVIRRAIYGDLERAAQGPVALVSSEGPPIRVTQELRPVKITETRPGAYLYDLGQNMVGWTRLKVQAPAGTEISMRFGEILNKDGSLYTTNLRSARATDTYICKGKGVEIWEPHFTFHGFRYVELTGFPGKPGLDALTGRVVGSDTPLAGTFACSNPMVNKLDHNIVWGQRGNLISVPTDCPQRDERLGWMGDAQIFVRTATYNRDVASFYSKWMQDVEDGQSSQGGFSDVSPRIVDFADGAPAWGDAGVIVPWTIYLAYGDTEILKRRWTAMNHWMDYITSVNPNGLWLNRRNNDFGDWLSIAADTPKEVLATGYYGYDASLMAKMARALGKNDEAAKYDALFAKIKAAFIEAYVTSDGHVKGDTQTSYLVALRFNLLPDALRAAAAQHLADAIHAKNDHLSTGFVGVGYLCPTLTATGHNDIAYKLLQNDTFPSWGFSIKQGATTIWERWDGYTPDKGFQDPGMNSFNHYSLGSVGEWLYASVAGIAPDPADPGYHHMLVHPQSGAGIDWAGATYDSIHGPVASHWKQDGTHMTLDLTLPANTSATVWIPTTDAGAITEGGKVIAGAVGVRYLRTEPGFAVYEVQSGTYHFGTTAAQPVAAL